VEISLFERGWVTLNANFRGKGASPPTIFGTRKVESLGYRMVKKIAEKFNRLSRVHQRHRRQTDDRQTESRWQVANVNASSRPLIKPSSSEETIRAKVREGSQGRISETTGIGFEKQVGYKPGVKERGTYG